MIPLLLLEASAFNLPSDIHKITPKIIFVFLRNGKNLRQGVREIL